MRLLPFLLLLFMIGCHGSSAHPVPAPDAGAELGDGFLDAAGESALPFVHWNGMSGEYYACEMMGPGAALFDYDGDRDLDVFIVQGELLGREVGKQMSDARFPPPEAMQPLTDRLYRNQLAETGRLAFTDVTPESGIAESDYGMGVATGDYDNDGDLDLYVANFGANRLWRNNGDRTFSDVTAHSGTGDAHWSASVAFVDYDLDGWLDLFVCNYIDFSVRTNKLCHDKSSARDYCGPKSFAPSASVLYRNRGDGTFEDASVRAGIASPRSAALGVVCADLNGDMLTDIYVANDADPNLLWINLGDGTFKDMGLVLGAAVNARGAAEASMGIVAEDFDHDLDFDLFTTHLLDETHTFYRNNGKGVFRDNTAQTNLGLLGRGFTGFGIAAIDCENDSWLDLAVANGEVRTIQALARSGDPFPLHQRNQLFRNSGNGSFYEAGEGAGAVWRRSDVGRGIARGDVDNDGDADLLITTNNGPARLLLNRLGARNAWIGVEVRDAEDRRDLLHTNVVVVSSDGSSRLYRTHTDDSYLCASDARVLAGLGSARGAVNVRAYYPGGGAEEWTGLETGRYHRLVRGKGSPTTPWPGPGKLR